MVPKSVVHSDKRTHQQCLDACYGHPDSCCIYIYLRTEQVTDKVSSDHDYHKCRPSMVNAVHVPLKPR